MSLHLSQRLRGIRETCFWAAALLFAGPEPAAKDSPPATGAGASSTPHREGRGGAGELPSSLPAGNAIQREGRTALVSVSGTAASEPLGPGCARWDERMRSIVEGVTLMKLLPFCFARAPDLPPSMPGAALPGPAGMSRGAPVRPDLEGPGETPEVDERRWHLQGTIQSMPASAPAPREPPVSRESPAREPSRESTRSRSREPAGREGEAKSREVQPLYDLFRDLRELVDRGYPGNQWPPGPPPPSPAPPPPPPPREDEAPKISKWVEDFRKKMQAARQLAPELRTQRKELQEAVKAIEQKGDALRQSCAEAEREAREDFEMLRSHLNSVESLKQAVLNREKEVRLGLLQSIEEFQRALQADGGVNAEAVAAARAAYPDPYGAADALCSRASSLPQVEVPIDDIPFEARARSEKLRRHVISERLLKAKDLSLWRLEQQRRQLQAESQEAAQWLRHLGSMLDRYAARGPDLGPDLALVDPSDHRRFTEFFFEELGHICYFCAERFCAPAANTRCPWNLGASPRSGRHLSPDPRVPSALWGAGVHFWVPLPAASSQTAAAMAGFIPDARWEERSGQERTEG
eukprot:g16034.t1